MAPNPKVDNIIQTTTADDVLDSSGSSSSFDLDDYSLDNYDSSSYDDYLDDYNLDDYDDYLDDYDSDYGLDNYDDYDSGDYGSSDDYDYDYDDDLLSGGSDYDDYSSGSSPFGVSEVWFYASAGLHAVGLLAFIALLLVTLCFAFRKGDGTKPGKSTALSLVFFILWSIFAIVNDLSSSLLFVLEKNPRAAITVLTIICYSVANILLFSILYRLLNDRFNRLATQSGFHKIIKLFHWGSLGLLTVLYFVRIILNIALQAKSDDVSYGFTVSDPKLQMDTMKFSAALDIISWLASLEILACSVLVFIQSRSSLGGSIAMPISLTIAAFAFFVGCLTNAIISIHYTLMENIRMSYVIIPETLFGILCPAIAFIAIILILAKSDRWETPKDQVVQPQGQVQYQQPMGENQYQQPVSEPQYQQPQPQYAPAPGSSPVSQPQPTPPPQQAAATPPPQQQYQAYQAPQAQTDYAQPQAQYSQVPVPAAYPQSGSPHPA
ncbi:hypothetical protein FQN54_008076 [Arachnomyces sp. PD_36]|nr:hypothetical protein FQN54_008076 [Arachnomyces sp. PD_36]